MFVSVFVENESLAHVPSIDWILFIIPMSKFLKISYMLIQIYYINI